MSRIFVAEDDQYISRVYERAFRAKGHQLTMAVDGEDAWHQLSSADLKPEAIILDLLLPKMNGLELLEKIRNDDACKSIPVAVLSNSFSEDAEATAKKAGADLFMLKIDHETMEVVKCIEELIEKGRI